MDTNAFKNNLVNKVVNHMMNHDAFSQWMQLKVLAVQEGYSKVQMVVRKEMVNGFGIVHGGLPFSLADSAFAFACNNRNNLSVARCHHYLYQSSTCGRYINRRSKRSA